MADISNDSNFNKIMQIMELYSAVTQDIGMKGDVTSKFLQQLLKDGLARYSGEEYTLQFTEAPTEEDIDILELSDGAKTQIKAYLEIANAEVNNTGNQGGGYAKKNRKSRTRSKKARKASAKKNRKL